MKDKNSKTWIAHYEIVADEQGHRMTLGGEPLAGPVNAQILDKVIWLVPPQRCLFKQLEYDAEYVTAGEIAECLSSDIEQWTIWPQTASYFQTQKVGESWRVAVWIWDESVEQGLLGDIAPTHIVPLSAYLASAVGPQQVLLHSVLGQHWSLAVDQHGLVQGVHPVTTPLQQQQCERRYQRWIASNDALFQMGYRGEWNKDALPLEFKPKRSVIAAGKRKGVTDFTDIQTYLKPLGAIALAAVVWIAGDYLIVSSTQSELEAQSASLAMPSREAVTIRQHLEFEKKKLRAITHYKQEQVAIGQILQALSKQLPHDTYLTAIEVEMPTVTLVGQGVNVAELPAVLEQWEQVKSAAFISDIRQVSNNRESFRLQLELKEASHD
ncbi:hypothetical protein ABT56_09860 [Photobacterium aquae]|uniref:Type II secretion system protein L n=1 Tax=Photobacterium aquae TaxID=1195763 RepID=A0A0J1H1X0_9GAMM|nr:PilN domain-containing protein [Photobacterium aquae]KLV05834.1 hypothetical protein ABT56_09860 [Photobacterium aquae]